MVVESLFLDAHSVTVEGTVTWTSALVQTPVRRFPWALQYQGTAGLDGCVGRPVVLCAVVFSG